MSDSKDGKQIVEGGESKVAERVVQAPMEPPSNVVGLDAYRERSRNGGKTKSCPRNPDRMESEAWERTSQQLLSEDAEHGRPAVTIVKVSSGFGKLRVPAWNDHIRCQAAAA